MKKRQKAYKPKPTSLPMLVNRKIHENVESIEEFSMLTAFQYGHATKVHFDYLVRMANMLNCAAQTKGLPRLATQVDAINYLAKLVLERYHNTAKFGVTAQELNAMRDLVRFYDDFWKRQTTDLYNQCAYQLNAFYDEIAQKKQAA